MVRAKPKVNTYTFNREKADKTRRINYFNSRLPTWKIYYDNPRKCAECQLELDWFKRHGKFCSSRCSGISSNKNRTQESIDKQKLTLKLSLSKRQKKYEILGEYSKIFLCKCKFSGITWYCKTVKTIHPSVINSRMQYAYQCKFTFGLAEFGDYFSEASSLIQNFGWYSASNRGNNLSGCSRDHMYSVADGFKNKVSPNIISHPANCKVLPHRENQSKNKKSSITLDELMIRINDFESYYGVQYRI